MLGIRPADLNTLESAVFWQALRVREEEKNADRRHIGELVRGAALRLFNTQVKHPVKEPQKFWAMPWDPQTEAPDISEMMSLSREERLKMATEFAQKHGIKESQTGNNG